MTQPIWHVSAPNHLPVDLNIAVEQIGRVHYLVDVECIVRCDDDSAVCAAEFESLQNGRSVIDRLPEVSEGLGVDVAFCAVIDNVGPRGSYRSGKQ